MNIAAYGSIIRIGFIREPRGPRVGILEEMSVTSELEKVHSASLTGKRTSLLDTLVAVEQMTKLHVQSFIGMWTEPDQLRCRLSSRRASKPCEHSLSE